MVAQFFLNVSSHAASNAVRISLLVNCALGQPSKKRLRRGFPARSLRMSSSVCLQISLISAEVKFLNFMMASEWMSGQCTPLLVARV